jgi:hypothetical protein
LLNVAYTVRVPLLMVSYRFGSSDWTGGVVNSGKKYVTEFRYKKQGEWLTSKVVSGDG